ncbi:MAG: exonuclease SbcCD subunit D [Firmicutes bacterium]|nr:exonuclease SbcCD subunit D [Dethiobacter sp.]MBS3889221.1 exonuclease SbcCD subunit D [Bacillota bacterium]MBS4053875.1 exonuclease SbcCD subunit D [Thermaerobacter sp.]
MRILHTSDWHLGRSLEGRSRYQEQVQFVNEVAGIAEDEGVHMVVIAGDVFDTYNPSAEAEELYCRALEQLAGQGKRCVVVVAGNHDSPERLGAIRPLALRHGILIAGRPQETLATSIYGHGTKVVQSGPGFVEVAWPDLPYSAVVSHLPYPSESRLGQLISPVLEEGQLRKAYAEMVIELLDRQASAFRADTVNIVVSHLLALGGLPSDSERAIDIGGACAVDYKRFPRQAQYIALGHLHRPQQMRSSGPQTYYSGSPLAYSFSETLQTKVVYVVDVVPGQEAEVKAVSLKSGIPLERWRCLNGVEEALRRLEGLGGRPLWLELEVHADKYLTQSEVAALRQAHSGLLNVRCIVPLGEADTPVVALSEMSVAEVFARFYKHRLAGAVPRDELVELFTALVHQSAMQAEEGGSSS